MWTVFHSFIQYYLNFNFGEDVVLIYVWDAQLSGLEHSLGLEPHLG